MCVKRIICLPLEHKRDNVRLLYSRFAISPFFSGQANTIGTAIRRSLLGDIKGTFIIAVKIEKIFHEHDIIDGIYESVDDIILNLRNIVLKSSNDFRHKGYIKVQGPYQVTAKDFILPSDVQVIDPTQHIVNIVKSIDFELTVYIERRSKYDISKLEQIEYGFFPIDSFFSPIKNVNYTIHSIGEKNLNQELLILEIWTNGEITPTASLVEVSKILIDFFQPLVNFVNDIHSNNSLDSNEFFNDIENNVTKEDNSFNTNQFIDKSVLTMMKIEEMDLSIRTRNCLYRHGIKTIGQLVDYTEDDLLNIKHFGKRSLDQLVSVLKKKFGITLKKKVLKI